MKTFKININDELHARRKEGMTLQKNRYNENNLSKNSFDYDNAYAKRDYNDPAMKARAKNRYFNLLNEIDAIYKKYNEENLYTDIDKFNEVTKKFESTPKSFSKLSNDPELKYLYETQERFYELYPDEWIEEWDKEYNAKVVPDQNPYNTDESVIENCLTTDKLQKQYEILKPYIDKVSDVTANNDIIEEANKLKYHIDRINQYIKSSNVNYDKAEKDLDDKHQNYIDIVNKYGDGKSYEIKFSENDEIDKIVKSFNIIPMNKYVINRPDLLETIDDWYTAQLNKIDNYYNNKIGSAKKDLEDFKYQLKNLNANGKSILDIPNIQEMTHKLYIENIVPTNDDIKLLKHNHQLNKYYINFDVKNENIDNLQEQVLEYDKYVNLLIKIKQIFDVKADREEPKENKTRSRAGSKREDIINKQTKALNKLYENYNFSDSITLKNTLADVDKNPKKQRSNFHFNYSFNYEDTEEDRKKDDYKSKSVKTLEHKDANFQLIRIIDFDYIIFGDRKIHAEKLDSKNPRMLVATIEAGILASGKYGNNSDDSYFPKDHNKNAHVRLIYGDKNKFVAGKSILDISFEVDIDDKDPNIKLKDEFNTNVLIPLQNGITYNGQTYKIGGLVTQETTAKETKDIAKKAEEANTNKAPEEYKTYFVGVKTANKFDALENSLYDLIYNFEQSDNGYIINYQVDKKTDKLVNVEFPVNFYNSVVKHNEAQKETIMIPTNYIQFDSYLDKNALIKLLEEKKVQFDAVYTAFEFNNSVLPDMYEAYKKKNKIEYNRFEGYSIDVPKEQEPQINNVKYDQEEIDEAYRTKTDTEELESDFNIIPANYNYDKSEKQYGFCYLGLKKNDGKFNYKYVLDNAQLIEDYITKALIEYTDKFNDKATQSGDKFKIDYPYVKVAINNKLVDLMIAFTHNSFKMLNYSVKGLKSFGEGVIDTVNNTLKRYKIAADTMSVDLTDIVPYVTCVNDVNNHLKTTNMNNADFNEYARNNVKSHIKPEEIKMFAIELKDDSTGEVKDIKKLGIKFDMIKSDILDIVEGLVGDFTYQLLDSPIELLNLNISNLSINISLKYTNKDILNQMPAAIIKYMNEDGQCKIKGCTWYEKI
jgi:hypothetical protein